MKMRWEIPGRVLVLQYEGMLASETLLSAIREMSSIIDREGIPPVHSIIDISNRTGISPELYNLKTLKELFRPMGSQPIEGWSVTVDPTPQRVLQLLGNATAQVTNRRLHLCMTMDEALQFLRAQDTTLVRAEQA